MLAVVGSCCEQVLKAEAQIDCCAHRFQQEAGPVLEEMGSSLLQREQSNWTGSPRGPLRRDQAPFAFQGGRDEEERGARQAEVAKQEKHAESLLQPLQQLECVVVAGESLCRQVCHITNETHTSCGHT